ncbi:FecR domain-containing protein [Pedobacter sp. MC2016-15]|uniref:FecR family protein n=1 Tax=Pedobacter sp. MC2016-15 TaxID=2994473 RepID=UPI002247807D|nr:FecR domain-containing protein [Pedobacter sp. MC2016-15]MCX2479281.1 FecR domain-containing protein [Pedobacter sp. MC2016-15]
MEEFETNEEFIYSLIIDELDELISPEKKHLLQSWRAASPENEATYQEFVSIQQNIDLLYQNQAYTPQESWEVLDQKLAATQTGRMSVRRNRELGSWLKIAASVMLILSIGYYFVNNARYTIVENGKNAAVKNVFLPDGTQLALNGGASIRYISTDFNTDRKVKLLKGEVFVKVKHDQKYPFVVDLGEVQARDIGTSFNIIKNDRDITVTVEEGKVALERASTAESVLLGMGLTGRYSLSTKKLIKEQNQDVNYKAWADKKFVFVETPLKEVTSQLSKVYRTQIAVNGNELKKKKLTAHLYYQTPDSALNVIAATLQCRLTVSKGGFILSDN